MGYNNRQILNTGLYSILTFSTRSHEINRKPNQRFTHTNQATMTKLIDIPSELMFDGTIPPAAADIVLSELEAVSTRPLSDWQRARLGKITASRFGLVKRLKNGEWGETALSYLYDLLGEHLTGEPSQTFQGNDATEWGNEYEAEAIAEYTRLTGRKVRTGQNFLQHPELALVGGTPDGLVGERGILEVKCPFNFKNHIRTVITREVPDEYRAQVNGHLLLSGRDWCDFVSYDPRIPKKRRSARIAVIRVERNPMILNDLNNLVGEFHDLLLKKLAALKVKPGKMMQV